MVTEILSTIPDFESKKNPCKLLSSSDSFGALACKEVLLLLSLLMMSVMCPNVIIISPGLAQYQ